MIKYLGRQFLSLLVTLFLITLIIFFIFSVIPGDPVNLIAGVSASDEQIAVLREKLGLDQNLFQRYITWMKGAVTGDFGNSIQYGLPVRALIGDRLVVTTVLAVMAIVITLAVSVPLGIAAAYCHGRFLDKLINHTMVLGLSIPNYFLGILLIWVFGIVFKVFVPGQFVSFQESWTQFLGSLFFPALAIAVPKISMMTKFIRSSVLTQFRRAYVRTAKSKGESRWYVISRHILRNAVIPVATLLGMIITDSLAGSIIIEQVYGLPGIGRLLIGAINSRDFPVVMTLVVYIAFLVVLVNFLVELLIRLNDPRIKEK